MGISASALSVFELGQSSLSAENVAKYAKLVGVSAKEVRSRWLHARAAALERQLRQVKVELKSSMGARRRLPRGIG